MIGILIADSHAIAREGLKRIIGDTSDMQVVAEAGYAYEVIEKILDEDVDVVVADINLPGGLGVDIIKAIKNERPKLPVLVLSVYPEQQYAVRTLRAGAAGYLSKDRSREQLLMAIRKVFRGAKYITDSLAEELATYLEEDHKMPLHEALSNREFQIMCMMASGKAPREIAQELSLSVKTISTYRSRILGKMTLHNNAEIIHYAIQNRLL